MPCLNEWSRTGSAITLTVQVPFGATAEVHVPAAGPRSVTAPAAARLVRTEPGFAVHEVPGGRWRFTGSVTPGGNTRGGS